MNTIQMKSLSLRSVGTMLLLGLATLAGTGPVALGQDTVLGKLTLPVEARLGNTMLPPGEYKLCIQLLGTTLSFNSIQAVNSPVMVLVTGMAKGGPVASTLAMASRQNLRNPQALNLVPDTAGTTIHSISLDNLGLVFQFVDSGTKDTLHAKGLELAHGASSGKGSD